MPNRIIVVYGGDLAQCREVCRVSQRTSLNCAPDDTVVFGTVEEAEACVTDNVGLIEAVIAVCPSSTAGVVPILTLMERVRKLHAAMSYIPLPSRICVLQCEDLRLELKLWKIGVEFVVGATDLPHRLRFLQFERLHQKAKGLTFRIYTEYHRPVSVVFVDRGREYPLRLSPALLILWIFLALHRGHWFTPQHIADELNENPYYEHFLSETKTARAIITAIHRIRCEMRRAFSIAARTYDPNATLRQNQLSGKDEGYTLAAEIEWQDRKLIAL